MRAESTSMTKPTTKELAAVIAESAGKQLLHVEHLLVAGGVDVRVLARAIGGNAAMALAASLGLGLDEA